MTDLQHQWKNNLHMFDTAWLPWEL